MWKSEKDEVGNSQKVFLVTCNEAKVRAGSFSGEISSVISILNQMADRLESTSPEALKEFREGLLDFFGRFLAYDHNLMRVTRPEAIQDRFIYEGDINIFFAEGLITAAGICEYLSDGRTLRDTKVLVDFLKLKILGMVV